MKPRVLVYHGIAEPNGGDTSRLLTAPRHLEAHIRFLQGRGFRFLTAEELLDGKPPRRTAVLTFDDGFRNWVTAAQPLLERLGVRGTFYLCPGRYRMQHPEVSGEKGRLLDQSEARALAESGMELGSHSLTHPDLRSLDDEALEREVRESKGAVEELTGRPCRTFAYPYGLHDERVIRAVDAAGYELAFTWLPGPWRPLQAPRLPAPPRHGALRLGVKLLGLRRPGR